MDLFNISRVCFALFLATAITPAIAANPPVPPTNPVGFTNITTPYSSTTSPPQISHLPPRGVPNVGGGSSYPVPPTRPVTPIVSNGGFSSPTSGGVTITGVKSPPIPVSGTANYPKPTVNNAAKSLLRNNLAGLALGAGLQALLNGVGALIDEGGNLNIPDSDPLGSVPPPADYVTQNTAISNYSTRLTECETQGEDTQLLTCFAMGTNSSGSMTYRVYECPNVYNGHNLSGTLAPDVSGAYGVCYYGGIAPPLQPMMPAPPDFFDDAVDNSYNPDPSDFDNLSPYMFPQSYTQSPIPTVHLPTVTTTETNTEGDTTTTNTTTSIDFTVDNSKPIPDVETTVTEDKESFTNGQPSGSSSTSTTNKPNNNPQAPPDPSAGGTTVEFPEIPTDCDFMPTVCAFLDWFKDDDLGDDPDLSSIMKDDEDFAKTKVISFGAAVCPQPYTINISSLSMTAELSFEFFCQFAQYARALVLAAAYIFAAYISLGVARG